MTNGNVASPNVIWEAAGYCGGGSVGELINSLLGRPAVVCGNARGVFDDFEKVRSKLGEDCVVFGVNDVGIYLPILHHWVSLHSDNLGTWKQVRWLHPAPMEVTKYHGIDQRPFIDYVWSSLTPLFSLSGYFAMQLAWIMGCSEIVLAGCPGDDTPRFFEAEGAPRPSNFAYGSGPGGVDIGIREQLISEMERLPRFKAIVRSTSGWTKEYFGGF